VIDLTGTESSLPPRLDSGFRSGVDGMAEPRYTATLDTAVNFDQQAAPPPSRDATSEIISMSASAAEQTESCSPQGVDYYTPAETATNQFSVDAVVCQQWDESDEQHDVPYSCRENEHCEEGSDDYQDEDGKEQRNDDDGIVFMIGSAKDSPAEKGNSPDQAESGNLHDNMATDGGMDSAYYRYSSLPELNNAAISAYESETRDMRTGKRSSPLTIKDMIIGEVIPRKKAYGETQPLHCENVVGDKGDLEASSKKRKADDISDATKDEEEEAVMAPAPTTLTTQTSYDSALAERDLPDSDTRVSTTIERPRKRLRRAAEVLTWAAIGGVAVFSALVVTAPNL
jgi:hypothetical protein